MNKIAVVLLVCAAALVPVLAQEAAGEMPPGMEEMMKLAAPGEHHAHMAKLVGKWKAAGTMWSAPGAEPVQSSGQAEISSLLGGRFFETRFSGDFMGMPFDGYGLDGYDNGRQKHIGIWADSFGTMMMSFEGDCSEDGKVVTTLAKFVDPASGAPATMKGVTRRIDDDKWIYEGWMVQPDGGEFKSFEIVYTRM